MRRRGMKRTPWCAVMQSVGPGLPGMGFAAVQVDVRDRQTLSPSRGPRSGQGGAPPVFLCPGWSPLTPLCPLSLEMGRE